MSACTDCAATREAPAWPPELARWLVELARRCGTVATDIRPCEFCGYSFDHDKLGRHGCPNCEGEPIDANDEEVAA